MVSAPTENGCLTMDNYTATEMAYKNGYEQGLKDAAMREQDAKDTNVLTNADRIRAMTDEELAEHNVREGYEYTVDYDYDDNPVGDYTPCYRTTDGSIFRDDKSAVEYELAWLKQPYGGAE